MDGNPTLSRGTVPPEKEYSAEELAQIHAAIMEELGINRLDTLHLADKGPPVELLQPLKKPKKITNTAIAAWHNLHLEEGVDPTKADLDNIADGQLYRLRRGASSSGSRGNSAPRGGHSSHGHRGGGRGGRGGHDHGANGCTGHGRRDNRHFESHFTPKSFYKNARENLQSSTHVERVEARLRGITESTSVNPPAHRRSGHGPGVPPPNNHRSKGKGHARHSNSDDPHSFAPQSVQPRVVLDNGDGFLKWAGIANSANSQSSAMSVVSEASQSQQPTLHRDSSSQSTSLTCTNGLSTQVKDSPSVNSLGNQGLLGSKWGPSPQQVVQSQDIPDLQLPSATQDNPASVSQQILKSQDGLTSQQLSRVPPRTSNLDERTSSRQVPVKIVKNGASSQRDGLAVMAQKNDTDELFHIILTDSLTGNILVDEAVSHDAFFEVIGSIVTYRAAQHTAEKPITWRIIFRLPIYAASFANFVNLERQAAGHVPRAASDMESAHLNKSISLETSSYSVPNALHPPLNHDQMMEDVNEHIHEAFNATQAQNQSGNEVRIIPATGAFAEDNGPEITEILISFGDDEQTHVPPSTMNSDIFELLEADDSDLLLTIFNKLGGDDEFFELMSQAVVAKGGNPVSQLSLSELLLDQSCSSVLQRAVAQYLSTSETFTMLPEEYCAAFIRNKSPKVMELAVSRRDLALVPDTSNTEINGSGARKLDENMTRVSITPAPDHKGNTEFQFKSQPTGSPVGIRDTQQLEEKQDARIKYSPNSLLSLRGHAVTVEISEQPSRERRPTRTANPHVTTVKQWQAFGAMESRSPGPALYTQTASSSIVPFEVTETPKATLPASKPSTVASREEPTTVPAISHSNPWQEFAAAEESRASAQDQDTPAASPEILRAAVEALQEAKSAPKASISTARVSSTVPTSLLSPQHAQRTDDALWAAILGSVGSSKSIVQPKPQVPKGNLRHRPSKSDINDRLAKDFSGLNLNTNIAIPVGEAITPISEKSAVAPRPELSEQLTPTPSSRHVPSLRGPSSAALTVVPEASLIAAQTGISMQSTPESSLMPRGQLSPQNSTQVARTPASQAMQRKITVALKQPLVLSPRLSPASSFTRPSSAADPVDSAESQLKTTTDVNKAKTSSPPITLVKSEPELKLGSSNGGVASHFTTMEAQSQGVQVNNPTLSVLSVDSDCRLPAAAEHAKPSDALDDKLNKVLKGAPGLSASKWAAEPATPRLTGPPLPRSHPSSFHPIQQPLHHPQGQLLHQVPTLGYTPIFTTVLVPDGPGRWKEVIGVETHSIPHVAHAPIPQATRPYVENIRPSSGPMGYSSYPASPNFPVLPQTFQHHSSFSSATSESTINPVAPTFKPSPQRTHGSTPVGQRQPLSPSKNLQSQLQSRLNSSMTGPRMTYQNPHL